MATSSSLSVAPIAARREGKPFRSHAGVVSRTSASTACSRISSARQSIGGVRRRKPEGNATSRGKGLIPGHHARWCVLRRRPYIPRYLMRQHFDSASFCRILLHPPAVLALQMHAARYHSWSGNLQHVSHDRFRKYAWNKFHIWRQNVRATFRYPGRKCRQATRTDARFTVVHFFNAEFLFFEHLSARCWRIHVAFPYIL